MSETLTQQERRAESLRHLSRNVRLWLTLTETDGKELAAYLGMSPGRFSERLNGKVPWHADDVGLIADFFKIDDPGVLYRDPDRFQARSAKGAYLNPIATAVERVPVAA